MQVDEQTQLLGCSTQQSVAVSSQRTAQYHWGATPQAPTQQDRQLLGFSHAGSQPKPPAARKEAGSPGAASQACCTGQAASAPGEQQQQQQPQQQQCGRASYGKPHLPPTVSGVSTCLILALPEQRAECTSADMIHLLLMDTAWSGPGEAVDSKDHRRRLHQRVASKTCAKFWVVIQVLGPVSQPCIIASLFHPVAECMSQPACVLSLIPSQTGGKGSKHTQ